MQACRSVVLVHFSFFLFFLPCVCSSWFISLSPHFLFDLHLEIVRTTLGITMGSETISLSDIKNGTDAHVQNTVVQDGEDDAQHAGQVAAKYMGTITDQREMSILGRTQVLRVRMPRDRIALPT
jgi:hypothetical protein